MRNQAIDFLRGIAVVLVLIHHNFELPEKAQGILFRAFHSIKIAGWIGVDLFFVLSGFLVSGLLFKEFLIKGNIRSLYFLIRRGFKIYPGYYLLLLLTPWLLPWTPPAGGYLSEALFLQNYWARLWNHTWSLAVEEHFYILVSILLPLALYKKLQKDRGIFPFVIMFGCVIVLLARILNYSSNEYTNQTHVFPSHLRIDSLMFGLYLSYLFHLKRPHWDSIVNRITPPVLGIAGLALLPNFIWDLEGNFYIGTLGFTINYIAFGVILVGLVKYYPMQSPFSLRVCAVIGFYSYSIYLWHIPIKWKVHFAFQKMPYFGQNYWIKTVAYLIAALVLGIVLSRLIEMPFLKLRDRLFPSRSEKKI